MGVSLPPDTMPHGPFSSKNHFAGWMLMCLSVTMGYLGSMLERAKGEGTAHTFTVQAAVLIMAVSLIQTQSRAGIVELALAIVVMGVLMVRRGVDTRRPLVSVSVIAVLLVTAVGIGGIDPIVERFRAPSWSTAHGRTPIWHQAASISRDFPLTGSGFNTFQTAVTHYPIAEHPEPYEAAHNDYLQLSAEGGLLLGVPAIAVIAFFVREVRNRFRESSSRDETAWLRIGAVLGLVLVAIQAAVDYSLQIPANAALFVVLAAMAVHRAPTEPHEQAQRRSWSQPEMTSHA
jgi:O-antigen ligase